MNDIDGNIVEVGDLVKVLSIDRGFLRCLDEDERNHHLAMLNSNFSIDEIVENGTKASVSIQWESDDGILTGGLYMLPNEFRLVEKSPRRCE